MKKIILSIILASFLTIGVHSAFASFSYSPSSNFYTNIPITITCSSNTNIGIYDNDGNMLTFSRTCNTTGITYTPTQNINYKIVSCSISSDRHCPQNITLDYSFASYIVGSEKSSFSVISPAISIATTGTFFPALTDGTSGAKALTASVGSASVTTIKSFSVPLAIVMGIILAFIVVRFIITLIYASDEKKKSKRV